MPYRRAKSWKEKRHRQVVGLLVGLAAVPVSILLLVIANWADAPDGVAVAALVLPVVLAGLYGEYRVGSRRDQH